MLIQHQFKARARLVVHQERPAFDEKSGLWVMRQVGEDDEAFNIVTDAGRVVLHTFIYGKSADRTAAGLGAGMHFIGLSNDGTAPAAGDTSLASELTTDGLGRAEGTVTLPTGSGTITQVSNQFTYTGGTSQAVQKTALFDASSAGNMAHEIQFTQRTLFPSDSLTLTFSITLT